MDVATLTALLAPALPFLLKVGDKVAEGAIQQVGADAWEKAKGIWGKLRPKVEEKEAAKEAAEDVAAAPEDEDSLASLRKQLKKIFETDPALANEITKLMQEDAKADLSGTIVEQTAMGAQEQNIEKVEGQNKVIGNIGNVGQNLNL